MNRLTKPTCIATAVGLAAAGVLTTVTAAGATPDARQHRGDLLAVTTVANQSAEQVRRSLKRGGFQDDGVRNGVRAFRIRYATVDPHGHATSASGLVALPRTDARRLRAVYYGHGTTSVRKEVASRWTDLYEYRPGLTYAGAGFAAVLPDYLGLGDGPGHHPWFDLPSETTASADMLQAAEELVHRRGRAMRRGVDVTGFSQGASAAMGLGQTLQRHHVGRFRLHALAPVSGAYDLRHAELPAFLAVSGPDGRGAAAYASYLLVAWNRLHHLYADPREVFREPYASKVERLFNGVTPGPVMLRSMPDSLQQLLTPHGLRMLRDPRGRFGHAVRVADRACAWSPVAPTRLYYAVDDEQAVNANTVSCQSKLARHGTWVPTVSLGTPDVEGSRHIGSNVAGVAAVAGWFSELR